MLMRVDFYFLIKTPSFPFKNENILDFSIEIFYHDFMSRDRVMNAKYVSFSSIRSRRAGGAIGIPERDECLDEIIFGEYTSTSKGETDAFFDEMPCILSSEERGWDQKKSSASIDRIS